MYLKKYDLSEKHLPDKKALELCGDIMLSEGLRDMSEVVIERIGYGDLVRFIGRGWVLEIYDTGVIIYSASYAPGILHMNSPYHNHLLLETQWRDPKVELPEKDCGVYVKLKEGIVYAAHHMGNFKVFYSGLDDNVIYSKEDYHLFVWIHADNVVL